MKKTTLFIAALFIAVNTIISCKTASTECASCKLTPPSKTTDFRVGPESVNLQLWKYPNGTYTFSSGNVNDNEQLNRILLNTVNYIAAPGTVNDAFVFYTTQDISANPVLNPEAITGYSIYYRQNERLRHTFYLKEAAGKYTIIPELNSEARAISVNNINDISDLYWSSQKLTAVTIIDAKTDALPKKNKTNSLPNNIAFLMRKMNAGVNKTTTANPNGRKCPIPCSDKPDHDCDNTLHGWSCENTISGDEPVMLQANALTGTMSQQDIDNTYDITLEYALRDSFLNQYTLGQKYVDYYYEITPTAYLSTDILTATVPVLNVVNTKAHKLLDYGNYGNEIFIDNAFKSQLLSLIALYKNAAPSAIEKAMFTDMETDVVKYSNLTYGQFVEAIQ